MASTTLSLHPIYLSNRYIHSVDQSKAHKYIGKHINGTIHRVQLSPHKITQTRMKGLLWHTLRNQQFLKRREKREDRREKREETREKRSQKRPPEIPKLIDSRVCCSRGVEAVGGDVDGLMQISKGQVRSAT